MVRQRVSPSASADILIWRCALRGGRIDLGPCSMMWIEELEIYS